MKISSIIQAIDAHQIQSGTVDTISYLSTNSRTIISGNDTLFFAIPTQRNDGHNYIENAYLKGARNFVVSKKINCSTFTGATFLLVKNTLNALQTLTSKVRTNFKGTVIGVTGSNGKTIVKEWLSNLLALKNSIIRNPQSYNSQTGVPLSAWLLNEPADFAILEAGISEVGEMKKLAPIIQPEIGIFTNIGEAHQANFSSIEEKIEEKLKLFSNSKKIIYCTDHKEIDHIIQQHSYLQAFSWSAKNNKANVQVQQKKGIETTELIATYNTKVYSSEIPFTDAASIENATHCLVALILLEKAGLKELNHFKNLQPVAMRLEIKQGSNNCLVINDSYNADLNSLNIALDVLNQQASKQTITKTLILSDIYFSSKIDEELYTEVAKIISKREINRFIGIGKNLQKFSYLFAKNAEFFADTNRFINTFHTNQFRNEAILLKGSRSFEFDNIAAILQNKVHETVLEIDLTAMLNNLNYFRSKLKPATKIMVMVKAFSYGAGTAEIARFLEFHKVDYLAVAIADEGITLRNAGVSTPIIVMNPERHSFDLMIQHQLEPNIYSVRVLNDFLVAAKRNATQDFPVHLKIDTGMNRLGFTDTAEIEESVHQLVQDKSVHIKSVFSHLVGSDDEQFDNFTEQQKNKFEAVCNRIHSITGYYFDKHLLNSGGIERFPQYQFEMVRLGLGLYGLGISENQPLEIVGTLKTTISQIRTVKKGESIGYSRAQFAEKEIKIGILPIGYADGINRRLGKGNGSFKYKNKEVKTVGNICMDMCMVDLTNTDAKEGDTVIIFGKTHSPEKLALKSETISYEIISTISQRVKRIYYQE